MDWGIPKWLPGKVVTPSAQADMLFRLLDACQGSEMWGDWFHDQCGAVANVRSLGIRSGVRSLLGYGIGGSRDDSHQASLSAHHRGTGTEARPVIRIYGLEPVG